jgi:rhomboid protease GluP
MDDFFDRLFRATPNAWVTPVLVALNVIAWLGSVALGADFMNPKSDILLALGGNYLPATLQQPYRLVTAMFLHAGLVHLAFNMWALWDMGKLAERFYGNSQFLLIYLLAGIFGSLASLFFGAKVTVAVGASGAVFGVAGALAAGVFTKSNKLPPRLVSSMRTSLLSFIGISLFMGFTIANIDNAAHIGGLVSGFALASVLAEKFDWEEYKRSRYPRLALACGASALVMWFIWRSVALPA